MQCSRTVHTLGRVCVQFFSSIAPKFLKNSFPPKKLFHPKSVSSKKSSTPKNGYSPKSVYSSKKVSLPKKCFTWKIWLIRNRIFKSTFFEKYLTIKLKIYLSTHSRIMKVLEHFYLISKNKFSDLGKFWKISKVKIHT